MSLPASLPVVDGEAALEFLRLIRETTEDSALDFLVAKLAEKGARLRSCLTPGTVANLGEADLQQLLRGVFATRRRSGELLQAVGAERLRPALGGLLFGPGPAPDRLEHFSQTLGDWGGPGSRVAVDVGADLLRHMDPARAWPWSRWIWDSATGSGAARLTSMESHDLRGRGVADTYKRIGAVVRAVRDLGKTEGFWPGVADDYGPDVFLACVYAVYTYTVLSMKMTREFTQVIPTLPVLAWRLLGSHGMEV